MPEPLSGHTVEPSLLDPLKRALLTKKEGERTPGPPGREGVMFCFIETFHWTPPPLGCERQSAGRRLSISVWGRGLYGSGFRLTQGWDSD